MGDKKVVSLGCDHAGYDYKEEVVEILKEYGYEILDHGTDSVDSTDYPDHIHPVGEDIEANKADIGVIMCGSGNGAAMTANKHQGVRAALVWNPELAKLARQHNDANVISIPARFVDKETAIAMLKAFLSTEFEGGRHQRRVDKIAIHESED